MDTQTHDQWLQERLPRQERLTKAVVSILENLLRERSIDFLSVSGRTKDLQSAVEKITRKGYSNLSKQFTDLSGLRVVVFFESDVRLVGSLIEEAFAVDKANSLDRDALLSADQIGYRSVHYVCDLGHKRATVDEYKSLSGLNFEIQVRTVLQHAWAELAHDRNYKFSGKLPRDLERKLYLYAGLLEIADRGFDETAKAIDLYAETLKARTSHGDYDLELTSLSLDAFVARWVEQQSLPMQGSYTSNDLNDLVTELHQFGISKLAQLDAIALPAYAEAAKSLGEPSTVFGIVRDWMLLKDWQLFMKQVEFAWTMPDEESAVLRLLMTPSNFKAMMRAFRKRSYEDGASDNND